MTGCERETAGKHGRCGTARHGAVLCGGALWWCEGKGDGTETKSSNGTSESCLPRRCCAARHPQMPRRGVANACVSECVRVCAMQQRQSCVVRCDAARRSSAYLSQ